MLNLHLAAGPFCNTEYAFQRGVNAGKEATIRLRKQNYRLNQPIGTFIDKKDELNNTKRPKRTDIVSG